MIDPISRIGPRASLFRYDDYEEYVRVQNEGNAAKIENVWAKEENIRYYARYLSNRISPDFGICHGSRRGLEQQWFADALGCEVIGTEIGDSAESFPKTIKWDFHQAKEEWIDSVDFIYSNSFDHSYDPELCLNQWMRCVKPQGLCLIEHSDRHGVEGASKLDPFGIDLSDLLLAITRWGRGKYYVCDLLEDLPFSRKLPQYLCCVVIERAR